MFSRPVPDENDPSFAAQVAESDFVGVAQAHVLGNEQRIRQAPAGMLAVVAPLVQAGWPRMGAGDGAMVPDRPLSVSQCLLLWGERKASCPSQCL